MHIPALIVSIIFSAMSATAAAEITITTSSHEDVQRSRIVYDCGGRGIPVEYINTGPVSLAVLEIDRCRVERLCRVGRQICRRSICLVDQGRRRGPLRRPEGRHGGRAAELRKQGLNRMRLSG